MKFNSWQSGSTLFVDNVEVGQQRNCKALFKNHFNEQLHSQTAKERKKVFNLQNHHSPNAEARAGLGATSWLNI